MIIIITRMVIPIIIIIMITMIIIMMAELIIILLIIMSHSEVSSPGPAGCIPQSDSPLFLRARIPYCTWSA